MYSRNYRCLEHIVLSSDVVDANNSNSGVACIGNNSTDVIWANGHKGEQLDSERLRHFNAAYG